MPDSAFLADLNNSEAVIAAIEGNITQFLLEMGRAGGGEEFESPQLHWIIGGSPLAYHNCVVKTDLTPEEVDRAIESVITRFQTHRVPGSWHIGPHDKPANLGNQLLEKGFSSGGTEIGMAIESANLPANPPLPAGFTIERVQDEASLVEWAATLAQGFGEGEKEARWVSEMYRRMGSGDNGLWRHYLGRFHNQAVATSTVFLGAGVAGVYFVSTTPPARRQGFGAAITLAGLLEARNSGYRVGVLGSSPSGHPVYLRLGFKEYCHLHIYEWE